MAHQVKHTERLQISVVEESSPQYHRIHRGAGAGIWNMTPWLLKWTLSCFPNPKFKTQPSWMTRAGVGTFLASCSYIIFFKRYDQVPCILQKYRGLEILVKQLTITGRVLEWQASQCTRYSQCFTHVARHICWTKVTVPCDIRLWSGCIMLKSPFNRQS